MKSQWPLYAIPALIWGSTWYVIKFQLGLVDPLVSVVYRYVIAAVIMLSYCWIRTRSLHFSLRDHLFILLQGMFLFGLNYWAAYEAEVYITSGMMAIAFSCVVFANSIFGRLLLNVPINPKTILGALMATAGTAMIFTNELISYHFSASIVRGSAIAFLSMTLASLGQIASLRNSRHGIPVIQANALGMLYGAIMMGLMAIMTGREFVFPLQASYISSLLYLAVFGSVLAFGAYLTLISHIGADRASYALVVIPVISVTISWWFEGYQFTTITFCGMLLILAGNVLAFRNKTS